MANGLEKFGFTSSASFLLNTSERPPSDKKRKRNEDQEKKMRNPFNRKYDESYIKYGFTKCGNILAPLPLCVVCGETLTNAGMKPSNLNRHLTLNHSELKNKDVAYFQRLKVGIKNQQNDMISLTNSGKAALQASFLISLRIAKCKKLTPLGRH